MHHQALAPTQALAWTLAITLLMLSSAGLLARIFPAFSRDILWLGAWEVAVYLCGSALLVRARGLACELRVALRWDGRSARLTLLGVLWGLTLQVPAALLSQLVEVFWPTPESELLMRLARLGADSFQRAALLVLVVALAGPCVEELFFRGALYAGLERTRGAMAAVAYSALCFVLAHFDPRLWLPLGLLSLVMSYLRAGSGSIWPGLGLHVAFNLCTLVVIFAELSPSGALRMPAWLSALGLLASLLLGWLSARVVRRSSYPTP